ncbi:MAG: hypothetical protein DME59_09780 [Verrucomicrobia bacterium]|nr:MAG: hypothetical protein DME59_09780 [Verrucomicrobiota bacterium]PYL70667.1 MAG: hypothetical protein DMF26_21360 [Verrucomicrobiota bacterium]
MNTWVEAPPRRKGLGCFAQGCLILLVFAIVLAIACFAGVYWGLHRHSALFYGSYWLAKTRSIAEAPKAVPEFSASDQQMQSVRERWQDFEQKTRAGQPAEIELGADDINGLIATGADVRGNVFASVEGNQLRLQTSVPIGGFLGRPGYYFNGDVAIELNGTQPLDNPQFSRITINGEKVPTDFLNWKYRSRRLREYLADQRNAYDIGTIEIRDGKVILRSRTE